MNSNDTHDFDVLVIGAGAGGLAAATRLALDGYKTLVVESLDRVGGRASTRDVNGFRVNTGAIAIELDGPIPTLLKEVGKPATFHVPAKRDTVLLWGKRTINMSAAPASWIRAALPKLLRMLLLIPRYRPAPEQTTSEWLGRITKNRTVHALLDNILGGFFAASGQEVPAQTFVNYMMKGSAFRYLGYAPGGTVRVWEPLASAVEERGGTVWLNSAATRLTFDSDGLASGAVVNREGEEVRVSARAVVSNIGPLATARLADQGVLPGGYVEELAAATAGGAIITVHFASKTPLVAWPALAFVGKSRRMTYAANLSAKENAQTKAGWYQYSAASTPRPACGDFNLERERALLLDDVRDYFDGFDKHAQVLAWDITAHDWPAQRAVSGHDLPLETPVKNLWNVGDGVKIGDDAGTSACVRTAEAVAAQIRTQFPYGCGPSPIASKSATPTSGIHVRRSA